VGYVSERSAAANGGIRAGDRILSINETPVNHWDLIYNLMYLEYVAEDITLAVQRNGREIRLSFPRQSIPDPGDMAFGITPKHLEFVIGSVEPGKPADRLGLKPNDVLLSLNGVSTKYEGEKSDQRILQLVQASAGKSLLVEWRRGTSVMSGTTIPTEDGRIGISFGARYTGPTTIVQYSILEALQEGTKSIISLSITVVQQISQLVTGKTSFSKSVGGPIKIAQWATQSAELGIITYLGFMGLLSVSLALLNILPFPALDGGHLLFLMYEGTFRREIPVKIKLGLQKAGFALLLVFMAFVLYNDIANF
jgi:regulator of sigma E protease